MSVTVRLVPLTDIPEQVLGRAIYNTLQREENNGLARDFPMLAAYRSSESQATSIARARRTLMTRPGYAAFAVMLGLGSSVAQTDFCGMTSFIQSEVPGGTEAGPNLAIWLDEARRPEFRRIGPHLMLARMEKLRELPGMRGRPWTVIRPDNTRALRVWNETYPWGGFHTVGDPQDYSVLDDGVIEPRQLFVANFTLEELRAPQTH